MNAPEKQWPSATPAVPAAAVPASIQPSAPPPGAGRRLAYTRARVREMLERSDSFKALPPQERNGIARHTVEVLDYLGAPEGIPQEEIARRRQARPRTLADDELADRDTDLTGFTARGAREGAAVAGALLEAVSFVDFIGGLITNVFTAIVDSSIKQMEAYAELVKSVAQTLNQFRDENITANQGRDHLVDSFPGFFEVTDEADFFGGAGPRVRLREGIDERDALNQVNERFPTGGEPLSNLDSETIERELVPAARTELATSRQQLLATMVLMGINRIIVTDGRISAKVLYRFHAKDVYGFQRRAVDYDYGDRYAYTGTGEYESDEQEGSVSYSREKDKRDYERQGGSRWSKGTYKSTSQPVIEMMSATSEAGQSQLETSAQLAGTVDVNFRSETFPLEKMADSFQVGMIQNAANRPRGAARGSSGEAAEGKGDQGQGQGSENTNA